MEKRFVSLLKDPLTGSDLTCHIFEQTEDNILEGLLVSADNKSAFPITNGVPVMLKNSFPDDFIKKNSAAISSIQALQDQQLSGSKNHWSFSSEWEEHSEKELTDTWGWTVKERYEQFLLEVNHTPENVKGITLLDAGCGNGILTDYMGNEVNVVVGLDYSDSVFMAEKKRKNKNVLFVKGDLQAPPFAKETFDLIVSNGVIHHTPKTETTFYSLAGMVKRQGGLYIWLYSRKGRFLWRFKRRCFDILRFFISRMGRRPQAFFVRLFTNVLAVFHRKRKKEDILIDMYDSLTPRWRHYHNPEEVSYWYYNAGFGPVTLTHFDNAFGFGVYAERNAINHKGRTPGQNYHSA